MTAYILLAVRKVPYTVTTATHARVRAPYTGYLVFDKSSEVELSASVHLVILLRSSPLHPIVCADVQTAVWRKRRGGRHYRFQGAHGTAVPAVSRHGISEHLELADGQHHEAKGEYSISGVYW